MKIAIEGGTLGILGTGSIARTMAAEFAKVPAFHCAAVCSRQVVTVLEAAREDAQLGF